MLHADPEKVIICVNKVSLFTGETPLFTGTVFCRAASGPELMKCGGKNELSKMAAGEVLWQKWCNIRPRTLFIAALSLEQHHNTPDAFVLTGLPSWVGLVAFSWLRCTVWDQRYSQYTNF